MKKTQLRIAVFFSLMLLSAIFLKPSFIHAAQKISIGVYDFKPLVFIENGGAEGFFIDFLNYVAEKEHWEITYVSGSWNDCLTRIETGKTDLQVAIAYSDERAKNLDFTDDYLISDWASVFKRKGSPIQNIFDLKDKTVSVVKSGITTDNFKKMLEQFGITCRLLEKEENEDNLKAVHNNEADAGISPNIYGTLLEHKYNLERTAIVFSPIKLRFAVKKDRNREIIAILDKYIAELKADKSSVYYQSLYKWLTVYKKKEILPRWALWILLILIVSSLSLFILNQMLKKMVRSKTSELISSEERFRVLFEQAGVGVAQIDTKTGRFIRINRKYCDIVGYTPEEMTVLTVHKLSHPEDLQADLQNMQRLTEGKIREFSMEKRYYRKNGSVVWVNLTVSPMWKIGQEPDYHIAVVRDISDRKHAEATLRKSEQKYRRIVDMTNEGIWVMDEKDQTTFVNQRMAEMLRYSPEEMMGQRSDFFVFEEDLRDHEKQMKDRKQGNSGYYERRFRRKDNTAIWTIVSATPLLNDKQQFCGSFAMITDITDRRQTEEKLRRAHREWENIFQAIGHATIILDSEYNIIAANRAITLAAGMSEQEMIGRKCYEIFHGNAAAPADKCPMKKMLLSNRIEAVDMEIEAFDGVFLVSCTPVFDELGNLEKVIHIATDITDRKRAEDALRENEKSLRAVMDIPNCAIVVHDRRGILIDGNSTLSDRFGKPLDELVGKSLWELFPPAVSERRKAKSEEVLRTRRPIRFEDQRGESWHDIILNPILDERGEVVKIAGLGTDITERKKAEADRQKLEAQLRHAQKMEAVGQLAGGVAHDFNNLLQVIIGYGDMMTEQLPPGDPLHSNLNEIIKSANRAAALVRQLLLFSRHETMQAKSVDMTDLISNLMNMIRRIIGEHISLEIRPGFALRPVYADPGQIEQVLMNLCVNARDAMPDGGRIIIATENVLIDDDYCGQHPWAKTGQYVLVTVSDTGCGIPHEIQDRIFEPFFTTKEVGRGTGLGLATVYGIVRSHQGMIHVYSEPGHGAAFKIYLPAIEDTPSDANHKKESIKPVAIGKETIMIAEDEDVVRKMMVRVLENSGYRVFSAHDGEEAISLFEKRFSETELVILDVIMPKVSGQKVYEHIKAVCPDMAVIFMSGYTRDVLKPEIFAENNYEMIQKPFSPSVLLQKIRAVLDAYHTRRTENQRQDE